MKLEQEFFVGAHDVDRDKKVTNKALLEMLSDISMLHGVKSGQTWTEGLSPVSWVVLGWRMQVLSRPSMFTTLRAVTWVRDCTKVRAGRDYLIYDENDDIIVKATAEWVAIDTSNGRFLRITPELLAPFDPEPDDVNFPGYSFPSVRSFEKEASQIGVRDTREMEIDRLMFDYNGHVHNSIYVNLAEQILPEEYFYRGFNEVMILYKLEITDQEKVLLEYFAPDPEDEDIASGENEYLEDTTPAAESEGEDIASEGDDRLEKTVSTSESESEGTVSEGNEQLGETASALEGEEASGSTDGGISGSTDRTNHGKKAEQISVIRKKSDHIVAVRRLSDRQLHAIVKMS